MGEKKQTVPPQRQSQPGEEFKMTPAPRSKAREYIPAGKLSEKAAVITGADSGIGRAVAVMFAKEGADVAVMYLQEHKDAQETKRLVEEAGRKCLLISGDVGDSAFCAQAIRSAVDQLGHLEILVNNAAEQHVQQRPEDITDEQLERTFRTNIFAYFYMVRESLRHMQAGATIINTTSVTAYRGNPSLLDYSSTKGAIVAFTRSLALALTDRQIRVNGVAPGPIWTPLIPATFPEQKVEGFGADAPMGRPGQPDEVAPCYVFLASDDSSYMTGQVLHPNGGWVING
ncbi:MAG: SDR family oxidoreductase [Planctomycetes bacterium]|nr:SDR family oxidoreductase [Planctomycetota bacterium]